MSLRILIRDSPRAIALASERHALTFQHSPTSTATGFDGVPELSNHHSSTPKCIVQFSALDSIDLSAYRWFRASGIHGTLGLINVGTDIFLCVISTAIRVATVRPNEHVQKILSVEFYCLNRDAHDYQIYDESVDHVLTEENSYGQGSDARETTLNHPCFELKKILSGGTFYYSVDFDLTNRLQDRLSEGSAFDIDSLDRDFLWNAYMIDPLIEFRSRLTEREKLDLDESRMLTSAIRGFVLTATISAASSPLRNLKSNYPSGLTVLSRLSCRRAGTRFNSRGIDDDGYVANFVESETVLWHPSGLCFSYAQIRGSIPIFWEQTTGLLPNQQKIQIARSAEATQPAFDKHFEHLELSYGTVHILNLMSTTKPGEVELTARYKHHIVKSPLNQVVGMEITSEHRLLQSEFDFHAETKGPGGYEAASMVRRLIQDRADSFAYLLCDATDDSRIEPSQQEATVILQQEGIFRTNCLDCLDRTNLIQTIISQMAIELFLSHRSERATADFWMRHSSLWADNGDALSKIYAGTGALKSSFTRHGKMSLAGAIADARKSATRLYINNFADQGRQNTIDMLLGRLVDQSPVHLSDPINDYVASELRERFGPQAFAVDVRLSLISCSMHEFSTTDSIYIWAGSFNLNGKGASPKQDLSAWLSPPLRDQRREPKIIAVGFQEIVELSPQQIMSTDPGRRQIWEEAVRQTINTKRKGSSDDEYVLLRSGQLVGAALIVFVKSSALRKIKNVEGSVKKVPSNAYAQRRGTKIDNRQTGMSGIAGNKGAVAIRMDYANTRICLVTAHLAAGFANYEERNRDYRTISHGLRFQRNRSIDDHDTIIWLGDFNYRIGLSDDKVRRLIKANDLGTLYQNDQLNLQMVAGRVFPHYSEAQITFLPTYKYNNGTDAYDTSEKARIPAWCDRILRKGNNLKQIDYTTAPLRFSDHRPVYATFQCTISSINEQQKEELSRSLYDRRKRDIAGSITSHEKTDEDLVGYDSIAEGLPPASSDRRKWWLDNGLPVRSQVRPPQSNMMVNPARPSNPFSATHEPDWVMVARTKEFRERGGKSHTPPAPPTPRGERRSHNGDRASVIRALSGHSQQDLRQTFDPRRSAGAMKTVISDGFGTTNTPNSPSSTSTDSSVRRKPAPQVPKKPAMLSTSSSGPGNIPKSLPSDDTHNPNFVSKPPPRRDSSTSNPKSGRLSDPRRASLNVKPTSSNPRPPSAFQPPPPPSRRGIDSSITQNNLLDEDIGDIGSLMKPLRPG
ncbi:MAG: hypothetical protein Q9218_001143 [Villophora microphyllina]